MAMAARAVVQAARVVTAAWAAQADWVVWAAGAVEHWAETDMAGYQHRKWGPLEATQADTVSMVAAGPWAGRAAAVRARVAAGRKGRSTWCWARGQLRWCSGDGFGHRNKPRNFVARREDQVTPIHARRVCLI